VKAPEAIIQLKEKTCGHACLAMLSGKSEIDIIQLIGHSRGTKTKEIINALNELNIKNSEKLVRHCNKNPLPEIGILKTVPRGRKASGNWHWILKYKERFLDPLGFAHVGNLRIVSFISIQ
jgi:hypothetical protein